MATPFSATELTSLPSLSAGELLSLMRQLETEANALQAELPPFVLKSKDRVRVALVALEAAYSTIPLPPGKRAADLKMDTAWRAFEGFLSAATLVQPHHSPGPKEAKQLYEMIFSDEGLRFITIAPELEYEETKKRLDALEKSNLTGELNAIGGALFLQDLQTTFIEYGDALHITTARPQDAPSIRPLWEKAEEAVRHYLAKVVALEDPEEPSSIEQIKSLLKPLQECRERVKASRTAAAATTPTAPPAKPSTPNPSDSNP